jgi:DNA-binding NtrC family response regulator
MARVLVADDEAGICRAFADFLQREGHEAELAANGQQALEKIDRHTPDLVFMDIQMPGMSGLEALSHLRESHPDLPVIIMTAYGTMDNAMEAMQRGAFDYIGKPVELAQVRKLLQRALHRAADGVVEAAEVPAAGERKLVGQSAAMQEIFKLISLLTGNDLHVLVTGETGVGKELVAAAIHRHGQRREQPFVALNCAAIPENLVEAELFGHEKGAFTGADARRSGRFEAAGEGTVFLDEITELPIYLQSKLLRVLQERSFEPLGGVGSKPLRARIIAASNLDLREQVAQGKFREDLYHRLNLVTVYVPPLRQRQADIALLARHFLAEATAELGKKIDGIEPAAIARLQAYAWPGNVRELEHCVKRAVLLSPGPLITEYDLDLEVNMERGPGPASHPVQSELAPDGEQQLAEAVRQALHWFREEGGPGEPFHTLVALVERTLVNEALALSGNNQVAAARMLGLHRTTLRNKLDESGGG